MQAKAEAVAKNRKTKSGGADGMMKGISRFKCLFIMPKP